MRKKLSSQDVDGFLRQYGRKAQRHQEPNDRTYSHTRAELIKHMDPLELDSLMRCEEEASLKSDGEGEAHPASERDEHCED
jgi:hypothetical protein